MKKQNTQRKMALLAGISLILMAITAGLTYGYIHGSLVGETAQSTFENIRSSKGLFKTEIAGWTLIFLLDALVAWALYRFFRPVHRGLAFATAFLRVVYTAILGVAIFNLPKVLKAVNAQLATYGLEERSTQVMEYLQSFEATWSLGLIVFGMHLLTLGIVAIKARLRFWGILLAFAGMSYMMVHILKLPFLGPVPALATIEAVLAVPMTVAELGFAIWLVVKGGKLKTVKRAVA